MLFAILIGIAFISALVIQQTTQAQRPNAPGGGAPGGMPGGGARMQGGATLEASWAQLCFEIGVDDATMAKAKKLYKEAWDKRKALMQKAQAGGQQAMQSMRTDIEKINTDLMTKLNDVLSPDQMKKLEDWAKQAQSQRRPPQQPNR